MHLILESPSLAVFFLPPILLLLYLYIHAFYLSPLKDIPGPAPAALSRFYEFYYNAIRPYTYGRRIEQLHNHYGIYVADL